MSVGLPQLRQVVKQNRPLRRKHNWHPLSPCQSRTVPNVLPNVSETNEYRTGAHWPLNWTEGGRPDLAFELVKAFDGRATFIGYE
jgi:hypothetical protein